MSLAPTLEAGQFIKPSINVGAGFDILNGTYYSGTHGEEILSGGLSYIMGFVGKGNVFKSTMGEWMIYTAMGRVSDLSHGLIYDTEFNKHETRMATLMRFIRDLCGKNLFHEGRLTLTDKAKYSGNKFFEEIKTWLESKQKEKSNFAETPFKDRDRKSPFKMFIPTFCSVDSFSEFDTDDIDAMRDKSEIGTSGQNMINMRAGLVKTNFLSELPRVTVQSNNYTVLVAQIGKNTDISASPHAPPRQQLRFLKSEDAIKGATAKFTFATHDCWSCEKASLMVDGNKEPEYPRRPTDNMKLGTDLLLLKLVQLRSKGGPSGIAHEVVVSQSEGVLPTLTEFHYLRERKLWGFEGSDRNYSLALYPEGKLTRPTVRAKIDSDARLRRAMNITMELKQMDEYWHWMQNEDDLLVEPKVLYDDLIKLGYDWNILLDTRGWWCIGENPVPYLSTMDLLNMRKGKYRPYWYDAKLAELAGTVAKKKAA